MHAGRGEGGGGCCSKSDDLELEEQETKLAESPGPAPPSSGCQAPGVQSCSRAKLQLIKCPKKLPKPPENESKSDNCWLSVAELAHQIRDADDASHLELIRGQTQTRGKVDRVASTLTRTEAETNSWKRGNLRGSRWCSPAAAARTNKSQTGCWSLLSNQSVAEATFHGVTRPPRCVRSRGEAWSSPFVVLLLQLLSAFHPADLAVAQPWTRASP